MSASPESVRRAFDESRPIVQSVSRYAGNTLRQYCDRNNFIFIERVKDLGSLSEKLESGRFASWSDLDDLYACRIVVPTLDSEDEVLTYLATAFDEVDRRGRAYASKSPEVFRFDGMRWYGHIRTEATEKMPRGAADLIFEIQVLTAFEHAWSSVTHALVYKSDEVSWKRQRLAAQLKAAVEQIELIIAAFEETSQAVPESPWPEYSLKQSIVSKFQSWVTSGYIPESITPDSWSRFADNVYLLIKAMGGGDDRRRENFNSIVAQAEEELQREIPVPVSGTLYQYVVGLINRMGLLHKIKSPIVPSAELKGAIVKSCG